MGYSCSAVNDNIYYFGGWCGHDICFHNSLNMLNTATATWKELQPTSDHIPVMKRAYGGMIVIEDKGDRCLLIIGSKGSPPNIKLPDAQYTKYVSGRVQTNEHTMYNISTGKFVIYILYNSNFLLGKWTTPSVIGECISTCSGIAIRNINKTKAIVFGGCITGNSTTSNIYIIDVAKSTVVSY